MQEKFEICVQDPQNQITYSYFRVPDIVEIKNQRKSEVGKSEIILKPSLYFCETV